MENGNGIVKTGQGGLTLDAYTSGLNTKLAFCATLIKSGMVPMQYKSPEAILAVMLKGGELGFAPMQSLELFDFIQGKVTMRAAGMLALVQSRGGKLERVEETAEKCTLKAYRPDNQWKEEYTFTMADAAAMGLTGKDNWKKMPKFMLYARCVSVLVRRGWADCLCGLYSTEEMQDSVIDVTPVKDEMPRKNEAILSGVTTAEALPSRYYNIDAMPEDKIEAALKYLEGNGATFDDAAVAWKVPKRLPKLDKYEVHNGQN